jgi:molybdopterin converting factor small subunit
MLETVTVAPQAALANTTVLFFGAVGDQLGRSHRIHIPAGGVSASGLRNILFTQIAEAEAALSAPGVRMAVDQVLTSGDVHIHPGAEVAFFSAFSGG